MFRKERILLSRRTVLAAALAFLLLTLSVAVALASNSGDDIYDPAAGGRPKLAMLLALGRLGPAGASSYSGDDAYDPAAMAVFRPTTSAVPSTYSGDDDYDPAARTTNASAAACGLPAAQVLRRVALRVPGGLSGDDAYDAAAGGTPELSLLVLGHGPGQVASCLPAGN